VELPLPATDHIVEQKMITHDAKQSLIFLSLIFEVNFLSLICTSLVVGKGTISATSLASTGEGMRLVSGGWKLGADGHESFELNRKVGWER
jgi:hypothetical protein